VAKYYEEQNSTIAFGWADHMMDLTYGSYFANLLHDSEAVNEIFIFFY
jgi:hypothetical protein